MDIQQNNEVVNQPEIANQCENIEQNANGATQKGKSKKKLIIAIAAAVVIITFLIVNAPFSVYSRAGSNLSKGNFDKAIELYQKIPDYKDSKDRCNDAYAGKIDKFVSENSYQEALDYLETVDIEDKESYITYVQGFMYLAQKNYDEAISSWEKIADFRDIKNTLNETYYVYAEQLFAEKKYTSAKRYYSKTENKDGTAEKIKNCELMIAESAFQDGDLKEAQELFSKLPKNLTYNGVNVAKRLELLAKNKKLVEMCGNWKGTNGKLSVRQIHKSTGLWDQWDGTYQDYLTVKCILNNDGTFNIKGTAKYYVYTNYSSLSYRLKSRERTASFSKTGKSIPETLYSDSTTTIKYDGSNFILNYDNTNNNYSINFDYRFKSSITYKK